MRESQTTGAFQKILQKYEQDKPQSVCPVESQSSQGDDLRLPMSSMSGTVIISVMFQAIALLLCAIEYLRRKPLSELLGCAQPTLADVLEDDYVRDDYADAVVTIDKKEETTVLESHRRLYDNLAKIQAMQQSMQTNQASFKKEVLDLLKKSREGEVARNPVIMGSNHPKAPKFDRMSSSDNLDRDEGMWSELAFWKK